MTTPNTRFRAVRLAMHMSQAELARAVRQAGARAGEPNNCSATTVQRWEAGAEPRGVYLRAIEMATGQPAENLGFHADERYGLDHDALGTGREGTWNPETEPRSAAAPLNGIWLSRYEYQSSSRGDTWFENSHYVMLLQHGAKLQVRSLPRTTPGRVFMDLTVNGAVATGSWVEETNPAGYYEGATYTGGIQLLLAPTGRRLTGKWVGFGKDFDVNTGPWSLELVTHDLSPKSQTEYNRPVVPKTPDGDDAERAESPASNDAP